MRGFAMNEEMNNDDYQIFDNAIKRRGNVDLRRYRCKIKG